jgi:hypothetical protein
MNEWKCMDNEYKLEHEHEHGDGHEHGQRQGHW